MVLENDLTAAAIVDPRLFTDADSLHGLLARLRRSDPMPWVETATTRPFWLVTRHADITAIELDAERFINQPRQAILPLAYEERTRQLTGGGYQDLMRNLVAMDGKEHRVYRAITQSHFLAKALGVIRDDVARLAVEFVDRMAAMGGECDFSADIAMWYPLRVIMTILGVPPRDEALMLRLTQQTLTSQDPEFQKGDASARVHPMVEMFEYFKPIIADRRANPRDDIASVIANATIDGAHLPARDVFGYFLILATAGHDTTSYTLAGGLLALLENPDEFAKLRADPSLVPIAVDEMIRWVSPVRHFCRTATSDGEIGGTAYKQGDVFLLSYPSANRDEAVFEEPFAFRVDRRPNRHLAFGTGPHLCLGQHLAKLELTSFLDEFLARLDHIELAGEPRFVEATFVGGAKNLPVRYRFKAPLRAAS